MKLRRFLVVLLVFSVFFLGACQWFEKDGTGSEETMLKVKKDEVTIGLEDIQQLRFDKEDGDWMFSGVFVYYDGDYHHIGGESSGDLFRFNPISYNDTRPETILDGSIESIDVITDEKEERRIRITSPDVVMDISVTDKSPYIRRNATLVSEVDNQLAEGQLGFSIRTKANFFNYENGFIATRSSKNQQEDLPYAFPALYGIMDGETMPLRYSIVVDTDDTSEVFNTARRRSIRGEYELGVMSSNAALDANKTYHYSDRILFSSDDAISINQLVSMSYGQFSDMTDGNIAELTDAGNRPANDYGTVVSHLYEDLMDERSGIEEYLGGMTPYGYNDQNGWGEAFAAMDVLKGMMRYAIWLDDEDVINRTKELVRNFVITHEGNMRWIEPYDGENAQPDEYFFNNQYVNGTFGKNDAGEETGNVTGISTWKYYDRVINLGELALLTEDEDVIDAYMSLMPFVRTLVGEDYFQPVAYFYETREPATGTEAGGSAGGSAMWGYTQLLAHELTDQSDPLHNTYLEDAKGSLTRAYDLGLFQMFGMRTDLKPTSIGWAVRGNVRLYELTGDETFLGQAEEIADAIFHFYYAGTNPQTYFPSYGFGYADNRERWEAYLEMSTSLWLMSNLMEYTDDENLMRLYYTANQTHLWAFPINGYPHGNPSRNYDSLDGYYLPFEFSTGVQGDNPAHDGGSQSNLRQIKQIYGSGEAFLQHQMFEAWGRSLHDEVLLINTDQPHGKMDATNHHFKAYNAGTSDIDTPIMFTHLPEGTYTVKVEEEVKGHYSSEQLKRGIVFSIPTKTAMDITVEPSDESFSDETLSGKTSVSSDVDVRSTLLSMNGANANHYKIEIGRTIDFTPENTRTIWSNKDQFRLWHDHGITYFVRVTGIDANGNAQNTSDVLSVQVPFMDIGVNEDFSEDTRDLWTLDDLRMETDHYMAIFEMLGERDGLSKAERTFEDVDLNRYPMIEFAFVSKNADHVLSLAVTIDGQTKTLRDGIETIEGSYIFDLRDAFNTLSGTADVTVKIEADGLNRSFALNRVRLFGETSDGTYHDLNDKDVSTTYAEATNNNGLVIINDDEVTDDIVPSIDVNFDPSDYRVLTMYFENVRAGDRMTVQIKDSDEQIVFDRTDYLPTNEKDALSFDLYGAGLTEEDSYQITYEFLGMSNATIQTMNLQGPVDERYEVTRSAGWEDGLNARLDDEDVLRLKAGSAYTYGEIKKTVSVDLNNAPIVTIAVDELQSGAQWALKVQPQGVTADLYVIHDNGNTGEFSVDLRQIITGSGMVEVTFKIFIISSNGTDGGVIVDDLRFGDSISLVSAPSDQVISETIIDYGIIDLNQKPYVAVDIASITKGDEWRIYVKDNETNRVYELKTDLEIKYPDKYNRSKVGTHIYDLSDIMGSTGEKDIDILIRVYGDSAEAHIRDIIFTSDNMIPVHPVQ